MTSLNLISHVCETRKFVMAILHWKQGLELLCDKLRYIIVLVQAQTTLDSMIRCNVLEPDHCPSSHCCVHDEYLFPLTYCKPFGKLGEPCVIRPSSLECHCAPGLRCISNIHGRYKVKTSLFFSQKLLF